MRDRDTGRSRGFGFVTYGTTDEANAAITALNEHELDGRRVKVNMANARGGGGGAGFSAPPPSGYGGGYGGEFLNGVGVFWYAYIAIRWWIFWRPGLPRIWWSLRWSKFVSLCHHYERTNALTGGTFGGYGAQQGYQGGYPGYQQQTGSGYGY